MTDLLKSMLLAVVAVLAPVIYSLISDLAPGIPITEQNFAQFLIWLVSAVLTGGAAQKMLEHFKSELIFKGASHSANASKSIAVYILFGLSLLTAILLSS